ncbi:YsnF/AvaK domain-containing protein [Roseomonas sp. GCM10028921]
MTRTITGLFDSISEAQAVATHLRSHDGIDPARIHIHGATEGQSTASTGASSGEGQGFWASLGSLFIPDEDRYSYSEGIRRGGYVVSAEVDDALIDHALDVFEEHGAVDLDTREAEWRSSGWSGYQATGTDASAGTGMPMNSSAAVGAGTMGGTSTPAVGTTGMGTTGMGTTGMGEMGSGMAGAGMAGAGMTGGTVQTGTTETGTTETGTTETRAAQTASMAGSSVAGKSTAGTAGRTNEERIPIVEERLRVGKREMDRGRVRVRSYVVETPVSETVSLREEHVHVERRPVDLPASAVDDAFRERTIEAVEHAEEAVVAKEARVKEELVIRKETEQREQTVSDTVRHTEVEVEDERTAGTTATDGTMPTRPAGT